MHILITVDPEIPIPPIHYGGIERIVDMLIKGLVERGNTVTLLAHADSKVPCELIPYKGKSSTSKWHTLHNMWQLYDVVKNSNFDVIHSFSRLAYLLPLLRQNVPKVMSYQREPSLSGIQRAHRLAGKKHLMFTGCSEYIASQIRTVAPACCIYNGCPADVYTANYEVANDAPMVFLGRIEYIKGTHLAIEVAKKTGRQLIIAGNIPKEPEAESYFQEQIKPHIDGSNIQYIGPVNDVQKNELLRQACCFLMPILWNEPFGIVMAEAMACGTPVIGFARGSVPEVVQHGQDGFVCSTVEEMAAYVGQIKNIDRKTVRASFESRFSDTEIVNQYLTLYKSLLQ